MSTIPTLLPIEQPIVKKSLTSFVNSGTWRTGDQHFRLRLEDVLVFIGLESLGTLAITGNLCLIIVLLRNKYLNRASFILMLSLAIADVLHGIVTTIFFYPPIVLKMIPINSFGVRIFNIIDWTAWSITLTHMSGICLDRLIAIMLYGRYNLIVTVQRIRFFTMFCWIAFLLLNCSYILLKFCCLIAPLRNNQFYTFGYGEFETTEEKKRSLFGAANVFTLTYTPLELATIAILSISNPITLVQLYRRHKRKIAFRMASTMLLEMSMRMGSKAAFSTDVRELASRRANRQQQRILLQISVVAAIFYLYMTTYYLLYHVLEVENKWVVMFNSFFYSTTHMINPVIYFSLNKEMRAQLSQAFCDFFHWLTCSSMKSKNKYDGFGSMRRVSIDQRNSTFCKTEYSITATESSPLVSQQQQSIQQTFTTSYASCTVIRNDNVLCKENNHKNSFQEQQQQQFSRSNSTKSSASNTVFRKHESTNPITQKQLITRDASQLSSIVSDSIEINRTYTDYSNGSEMKRDESSLSSLVIEMDDPMEIPNPRRTPSAEHLELDLISSCSVDNFHLSTTNTHDNIPHNGDTELEQNLETSSETINKIYQKQQTNMNNDAFLNLAKCLEEHAKSFFMAEKIAMSRVVEQRNSLLDALIDALKSYHSDDEGVHLNDINTEDYDINQLALKKNNFILPIFNANGNRRKSNAESQIHVLKTRNQRSKSFISNNLSSIDLAKLRRAISERSQLQSVINDINRKSHLKSTRQLINGVSKSSITTNGSENKGKSDSTITGSFADVLMYIDNNCDSLSPQNNNAKFHCIPKSSSWRQWRDIKHNYTNNKDCNISIPNFEKISKREMLRESLLMLIESAPNLSNTVASNTDEPELENKPGLMNLSEDKRDCCTYVSAWTSTDEDEQDFDEDVVFL